MRVEDRGESECLAVMAGIRTETLSDAKAGRLPLGLHVTREFDQSVNRERQMTAKAGAVLGHEPFMGSHRLACRGDEC